MRDCRVPSKFIKWFRANPTLTASTETKPARYYERMCLEMEYKIKYEQVECRIKFKSLAFP